MLFSFYFIFMGRLCLVGYIFFPYLRIRFLINIYFFFHHLCPIVDVLQRNSYRKLIGPLIGTTEINRCKLLKWKHSISTPNSLYRSPSQTADNFERNSLYKVYRISNDTQIFEKLTLLHKKLNLAIKEAKDTYYSDLSTKLVKQKSNPKIYWSVLKRFSNNKKIPCIPSLFYENKLVKFFFCKTMFTDK